MEAMRLNFPLTPVLSPSARERKNPSQAVAESGAIKVLAGRSWSLAMNLTSGARRLRRFNIRCLKAFEQGSGVNAALQFTVSMRECFWLILFMNRPKDSGRTKRGTSIFVLLKSLGD